jgi:hypothetical protein
MLKKVVGFESTLVAMMVEMNEMMVAMLEALLDGWNMKALSLGLWMKQKDGC